MFIQRRNKLWGIEMLVSAEVFVLIVARGALWNLTVRISVSLVMSVRTLANGS